MRIPRGVRPLCVFLAVVALGSAGDATAQDIERDLAWLIEALELEEAATVADVGAGAGGELTIALSPVVGPRGRVYASELGEASVAALARAIEVAGVENVTVLAGHPTRTNLPATCCDAIFTRFVYHHFADPPAMNASLVASLRPGGRLAVIDFSPRGTESVDPAGRGEGDQHGVTADTLVRELERAGLSIVSAEQGSDRLVRVLAVKE